MDDLISRQAAIDALKKAYWDKDLQAAKDDPCVIDAMTDWAIRQVKALPSAERRGRWVYNANFAEPPFKCSACGKSQGRLSNYCPDCGAKMDEVLSGNR